MNPGEVLGVALLLIAIAVAILAHRKSSKHEDPPAVPVVPPVQPPAPPVIDPPIVPPVQPPAPPVVEPPVVPPVAPPAPPIVVPPAPPAPPVIPVPVPPPTVSMYDRLISLGFAAALARDIVAYAESKGITEVYTALAAWNDRPSIPNASPDLTGPFPVGSLTQTDQLYLYAMSVQPRGNGIFEALCNGTQDAVNLMKNWAAQNGGNSFVRGSYNGNPTLRAAAEAYLARA